MKKHCKFLKNMKNEKKSTARNDTSSSSAAALRDRGDPSLLSANAGVTEWIIFLLWHEHLLCVARFLLPPPPSPAQNTYLMKTPGWIFLSKWWVLDRSFAETGGCSTIDPKRTYWPTEWFSKTPFARSFPGRWDVLNVSQITVTFYGISPPFSIQTGLQKYRGCTLCHPACCPLCNTICLRTMRRRSTVIP